MTPPRTFLDPELDPYCADGKAPTNRSAIQRSIRRKTRPSRPAPRRRGRTVPAFDPALADLLNPAIGQGRAGVGSQTGTPLPPPCGGGWGGEAGGDVIAVDARARAILFACASPPDPHPQPLPTRGREQRAAAQNIKSGLKPPPDNSLDRRADFANAHRARASVARGFGEAPQQGYVGKDSARRARSRSRPRARHRRADDRG